MTPSDDTRGSSPTANPLAGLSEMETRVLSYAASIGKEFDFSVLARAMEMGEEPLAEILEGLVNHGILKELKAGDSYAFARAETLTQAYHEISSSRLRLIHAKIAEAYEKLHPDPTPDIIPEMARQFYLGRVHDKSLLYNRYAAAQAMNAFSPDVAIRYLERAREDLAALPDDHRLEEADVLKEIGEQYDALGDDARAEEFYGESLKKLPEEDATMRALVLLSRAETARETDKLTLARQYCEEAIPLLEKVGHKKGLAMAHRSLGRAAFRDGQLEVGRRELEMTIQLLDPTENAKELARCYIDLGNIHSEIQEPDANTKSIGFYRKAIQALETLHDYPELARAHNNLALALMPARPTEAMEENKKARMYSEMTKDRRSMGWWCFNGVEIRLALGQIEEAIRDNEEADKILSLVNDPFGLQQVTLNKGIIAQYRKSYAESEKAYLESLKRAEKLGYVSVEVETRVHLASMYLEWGKQAEAAKEISRVQGLGEERVYLALKELYKELKEKVGHQPT